MRGLAPKEGDGFNGADGDAHDGPGVAVDAARQVDGKDWRAVGIDRLDQVARIALHEPTKTGTEQRIDDQRRPAYRLGIERQHRILPSAGRQGRISLQAVALAQQDDRDLTPACCEFRRGDETVATIVAGPGDDQDRSGFHEVHRSLSDGLACAQHQREARCTGGDGEPAGTLHFSGGKNSHAISPDTAPFPKALPVLCAVRHPAIAYRLIRLPISRAPVLWAPQTTPWRMARKSLITFRNQAS